MTRTTTAARLLLGGAVALLLITCTAAAWAMPHTRPSPPTITARFEAGASEGCDLIAGPATAYCGTTRMPGPTVKAAVWPAGLNSRTALLLVSTAAVAAAIGLVSSAGRRL
ncbi:hypothetical protein [Streptomyces sp. NPDC059564]|uniref:hypothetical protein n=1 Tax=Streptomyces sp. NPDC059564 TaxID=3346865 RepID=UPI0036B3E582